MDFYEVVRQVLELLQRQGRVSYRALKRQFGIDDAYIEDLKEELQYAHESTVQMDERGFTWTGETEGTVASAVQSGQRSVQPTTQANQPDQAAPPLVLSPPDAERRQLTVMFCDLTDSTRLSGQLDPEDLRDVIRAYQSTSAEVIERYDGYIAQHLGDGLMVYFGWPQAHEDDAQRAVHAGLGILEAMQGLNTRLGQGKGIRLAIRIGIHTGLVVVGEMGQGASQEHLALGETPNIASRIQGIAEPDTVTVSPATYQLIQGYFVCEDLGLHTLKGVDESQRVYRVVRASTESRLDVGAAKGLTPLVGREQEVGLLVERWRQVQEGMGQVVLLSGEAGIGKSRLVQVLKDHLADELHTLWECRSSPYYQNTALYPITDVLQRLLMQQTDTSQVTLDKLEQWLHLFRFASEETVPLLAALLSIPLPQETYPPLALSPPQQRQKMLETLVTLLLEQAEQQPMMLIVEDLHWTDPSTLQLLDLLIDQIPTASMLLLLTCRPTFQPQWGLRSHLTPLTLARLTRPQVERMIGQVAHGNKLPAQVVDHIVTRTDGVPLYVEEMTKTVLESSILREADDHYELVGTFSSLSVPATLQDSLMARLDRLVSAKGIAQMGATIGRQFSYQLLQAVSQLDAPTLQRELGRLVEAELLYQRGLPPEATYTFKHALIQDVAYESLLKSTRQRYHQRIAYTLETQSPEMVETRPEVLAQHCTEGALKQRAVDYWYEAGQRAVQRSANVEAISHLTKGLEVLKTVPSTPEHLQQELALHVALSAPLIAVKGYADPEVEAIHDRAQELCQLVGDTPQLFPVLYGLWRTYNHQSDALKYREVADRLMRLAHNLNDPALLLEAHRALGVTLFCDGQIAPARAHLEQSIALYDPQQHGAHAFRYGTDPQVYCLAFVGMALWVLGYPDQALERIGEALNVVRTLSHSYSLAFALNRAAMFHQFRRDIHAVHELADTLIALCTEQGIAHYLSLGTFWWGWSLMTQGQSEEGLAKLRQGMATYRVTGPELFWAYCLALHAEICGNLGQAEEGLLMLDQALALVHKTSERVYEAELHRLKGGLILKRSLDHHTEAEICFHQAISVARRQQAKSWELRAAASLARLWQGQGKRQAAYDLLQPVYGWFTEGFDTADLKDAKALLDELG